MSKVFKAKPKQDSLIIKLSSEAGQCASIIADKDNIIAARDSSISAKDGTIHELKQNHRREKEKNNIYENQIKRHKGDKLKITGIGIVAVIIALMI